MRYLLYCVFRSGKHKKAEALTGINGEPVFLVGANNISAALSRIEHSDLTPAVPRLLAYQRVIDLFHRSHTIIPIRYGCLFEEESHVIRLIEERCKQYEALLKELKGCVEMGVRVLFESDVRHPQPFIHNHKSSIANRRSLSPGRAYIAARKTCYDEEEEFTKKTDMVVEKCCAAFAGLFIKCKTESPTVLTPRPVFHIPLLSLYFLVPRKSVDTFRKAFHNIGLEESSKLLLSGPWPPYNFVLS